MSYADRVDRRFGPGFPLCSANTGRVQVKLDFGLGDVFTVDYQSGGVAPLLRAVAKIRAINEDTTDRSYRVHAAGHRTHGGYDVTIAGTYSCRPINNPSNPTSQDPSPHSWPVALDVNPAQNGWGAGLGDHPEWFRKAFIDEGFSWGGEWGDPMHYERLDWTGEWSGTYPESEEEMTKEERDALARMQLFWSGVDHFRNGKAPRKDAPYAVKLGYRTAQDAAKEEA